MQPGEVRLSVDCGGVSAVAVLSWPNGRWVPLVFDGVPHLPVSVYVDRDGVLTTGAAALRAAAERPERFVPSPLRRLREDSIHVGDRDVDGVDLVAAILRRIGVEAARVAERPVGETRLVVPASWGPRQQTLLRQAAHRAGLGQPTLIEAPVAAARRVVAGGTTVVVGSYVVVCDFGGGFEATVLRRAPIGFEVLSSIDAPDAAGDQLDEVLADELARIGAQSADGAEVPPLSDADRLVLLAGARAAKETLTYRPTVAAILPAPRPAVMLHSAQVEALARPVLARAAQATREAIDAAGIGADELAGVYCIGGAATPLAARVLGENVEVSPVVVDEPQMAAVLGAAEAIGEAGLGTDVETPMPAPPMPPLRRAAGLLVPGVASLALVAHFVFSAERSGRSRGYADPYAYVLANWGELAMATAFALITALVGATLIASTLPPTQPSLRSNEPARPTSGSKSVTKSVTESMAGSQQVGTGLLAAVVAGLAVAGLYAVGASVYFDLPTGGFLRWALLPILPIAAAATVTAVLATRWGRIPREGWHAWLTFPVTSVVCGAVGMLLIQVAMTARAYPTHALANGLVGRFGALLLGVGAALALVRPARFRIIVAAPLAVFTAAIVSWPATGLLGVLYIAAATVWWLQQVWRLLRNPLAMPIWPRSRS
jgi:hypothetical protein